MKKSVFIKITFLFIIGIPCSIKAQKAPENWYNLDLVNDKVYGVSSNKAYETILKGKTSKQVIVAIIDAGTQIDHEDLKDHIWINKNEIPGNGIDDDHNGYIDDINGWDFIGGKTEDIFHDNFEITRIYGKYKSIFENNPDAAKHDPKHFKIYDLSKNAFFTKYNETKKKSDELGEIKDWLERMENEFKDKVISLEDVNAFPVNDSILTQYKLTLYKSMDKGTSFLEVKKSVDTRYEANNNKLIYHLNVDYNSRSIVGDNYDDSSERFYGNNDVKGPQARHGTHVAGIIGAIRNNSIGVDGVADNVLIMVLRAVPDGDERDKDIANAIRYAAENGASIINMSFGKAFPYDKKVVDDAVRFAVSKDVLFIHAAGNDHLNLDKEGYRFPNSNYENGKGNAKSNWIVVGAINSNGMPGSFSNYGKKMVDVFAPGVSINSTVPEGKYTKLNGTSMATPVVAGVAAMIRSYYPELSAKQVKKIILKTVYTPNTEVPTPGNEKVFISWENLCKTGGIVNAYEALKSIH